MRTPVKTLGEIGRVRAAGFDTGLAHVAGAVIEANADGSKPTLLDLRLVETKKIEKKLRSKVRVSTDDTRRLREIYEFATGLVSSYRPSIIAVEWYIPNPKNRQMGSGWKTAFSVGGLLFLGWALNTSVVEAMANDKKKICGGGDKETVIGFLTQNLPGFEKQVRKWALGKREHPADAAAHALGGLQVLLERRREAAL